MQGQLCSSTDARMFFLCCFSTHPCNRTWITLSSVSQRVKWTHVSARRGHTRRQNGINRSVKAHRRADRGVQTDCIAAKHRCVSAVVVRLKTVAPPTETKCGVVMDTTTSLTSPHFCDPSPTADRHMNQDAGTAQAMSAMRLACETVRVVPSTTMEFRQLSHLKKVLCCMMCEVDLQGLSDVKPTVWLKTVWLKTNPSASSLKPVVSPFVRAPP